ncbi:fungal-specific transcription factor domain-containing protein [Calycina marina]|uniref:Fungal-specific transcription factor domain-containing protein n=1 Tax=Calycina marina TaxID=1763456 RepID=A0A9P7Z4U5_9HELO|nr:fungal-specific transcription factor domain-containing protein [Calycina marina]
MSSVERQLLEALGGSIEPQSPASTDSGENNKKRTPVSAGLDSNGNPKPVKRRAAKACAACRARKVRCDVMQRYHITADGEVTCSNCTMDGIKCVIEESKRRKKHLGRQASNPMVPQAPAMNDAQAWRNGLVNPTNIANSGSDAHARRWSSSTNMSNEVANNEFAGHIPHPIYQTATSNIGKESMRRSSFIHPGFEPDPTYALVTSAAIGGDLKATKIDPTPNIAQPKLKHVLPGYLKPLPQRMTSVDIDYLFAKGALSLPDIPIQNALVRGYLEYVHPYMPLIEFQEVLQIIEDGTGASGNMSLLLFQAIMFAGTAFVDMEHLRSAGYSTRKAARKAFFQKARVLYNFDYEVDRVSLVQSLLLMTYWYETPDDQKDTWHWMGVAISLAQTIGMHRNPENSSMEPSKKKLWKRIWWSCFMRDRLVALGMRRPTRVKDEDYDVPMLTEDDFEIGPIPNNITIIPKDSLMRDVSAQKELAQMCIGKAKLCLCISHVLSAQYSVLVKHQGMQAREGSTRSSVMLFPKKLEQTDEVKICDDELTTWINGLPAECQYSSDIKTGSTGPSLVVQRSLLHMIYFTTLSALHRPQVLPAASTLEPDKTRELQDLSRKKVREASREITRISQDLHASGLERYLPTTGVTVLLPAIIIHLLDIKSCNEDVRQTATDGFCLCMAVLEKLRDNYASADFATQFLEAAIRKAEIDVGSIHKQSKTSSATHAEKERKTQTQLQEAHEAYVTRARHTPPLTLGDKRTGSLQGFQGSAMMDIGMAVGGASTNKAISALTPPEHNEYEQLSTDHFNGMSFTPGPGAEGDAVNVDYSDYLNFNGDTDWSLPLDEGAHGER